MDGCSRKHPKQNEMLFKRMNFSVMIMVGPNQKLGHSVGYWFFIGELGYDRPVFALYLGIHCWLFWNDVWECMFITTTSKPFSQARWGSLDMKPNRNKRKPKQEREGKRQ
jgi:hypothetical protein